MKFRFQSYKYIHHENIHRCFFPCVVLNYCKSSKNRLFFISKKYQNIKVGVRYPAVMKKVDTREIENAALVQTPFVTSKKQIYGTLVKTK